MFPEGVQYSPLRGVKECLASHLAWFLVCDEHDVPEVFAQHAIEIENQKELVDEAIDRLIEDNDVGFTALQDWQSFALQTSPFKEE